MENNETETGDEDESGDGVANDTGQTVLSSLGGDAPTLDADAGTAATDEPDAGDGQSTDDRESGWPLPGRVQAVAGEFTKDTDRKHRDTQVGIDALSQAEPRVGRIAADDWLAYTVSVQSEGTYDLALRVASPHEEAVTLQVGVGETDLGPVAIPRTDGWDDYTTVTISGQPLSAGEQVLRIDVVDAGGNEYACNLDWVEVTESEYESVPQSVDADGDEIIRNGELLSALDHRRDGNPVPNTGGATGTDGVVTDLVEMWKDETDITEGDQ